LSFQELLSKAFFMESILQFLWKCTIPQIIVVATIENLLIIIISLLLSHIIVRTYKSKRVCQSSGTLKSTEVILTFSTLMINILVTLAGWTLWKENYILINRSVNFWIVLFDTFVLFFIMDLLMYILHRIAHIKFLFPILHSTHHQYIKVRPITLFVLNPLETLSFGILWLFLICSYSASGIAIFIYLALNIIFGIVGHLGVEPLSKKIAFLPVANLLTTSTFHAQHHQIPEKNYGFYTTIWDKLFKSLSPFYYSHFGKMLE